VHNWFANRRKKQATEEKLAGLPQTLKPPRAAKKAKYDV
jgi:hypothetical protein